jgi:hypothetical protein
LQRSGLAGVESEIVLAKSMPGARQRKGQGVGGAFFGPKLFTKWGKTSNFIISMPYRGFTTAKRPDNMNFAAEYVRDYRISLYDQ